MESITILLICKCGVEKLTKFKSETIIVSENIQFVTFLHFVFESYPKIQKEYEPGELGLKINGVAPLTFQTLKQGDVIELIEK